MPARQVAWRCSVQAIAIATPAPGPASSAPLRCMETNSEGPGSLAAAPPPCEGRTDANAKEGNDDARNASSLCVASDGEDRGDRPRCVRADAARRGAGVGQRKDRVAWLRAEATREPAMRRAGGALGLRPPARREDHARLQP